MAAFVLSANRVLRQPGRWRIFRQNVRTKSNRPSFKIRRGSCLEKLAKKSSLDTTRTLVWALRLQRRPSRAPTLTRNALLLVTSPFEGGSCLTPTLGSAEKTTWHS